MNKILLLFVLLSIYSVKAQKIAFPEDFKLDQQLLKGMVIAEIPEEFHSEGIFENPAVITDKDAIKMMADMDSENISEVYYEVYQIEGSSKDAGGCCFAVYIGTGITE